jgi:bacteriorhodopsin
MSNILISGLIIFSISSFYFLIKPKENFNSSFLVSFITLISYLIMLQGNFVTNDLYWTRWLFYGISCPLLAFEISKRLGLETPKTVYNLFLTIITMITGAFASISTGNYKLSFFLISSVAFLLLVTEYFKTRSETLKSIMPYIIFGWSVFPIVFMFSNEGIVNLISLEISAIVYLALDIFTKIVFYIHHNSFKQIK